MINAEQAYRQTTAQQQYNEKKVEEQFTKAVESKLADATSYIITAALNAEFTVNLHVTPIIYSEVNKALEALGYKTTYGLDKILVIDWSKDD